MARVNIEDDLWLSGRLSKLARSARLGEDAALGRLVNVYRLTQRVGVAVESRDRICTIIVIAFDSDDAAYAFIDAMVSAQLADRLPDDRICIRGNQQQIDQLASWRAGRQIGGRARAAQAKRNASGQFGSSEKLNDLPAGNQHDTSSAPAPTSSPISYLLSPYKEENTKKNTDLLVPQAEARPAGKRSRSPEEQARAKLVRDAFLAGYEKRYRRKLDRWGAPENAHVYHLLKSSTAEELAAKATAYFAWARPEVIRAGHPFMNHRCSFSATLAELTADVIDPGRRALAAQIQERENLGDAVAIDADQLTRINALSTQEDPFDGPKQVAGTPAGSLAESNPRRAGALTQGHQRAAPDLWQAAERRRDPGLVQSPGTVRQGERDLASARASVRGGQAPEHQRGQALDADAARDDGLAVGAGTDARGKKAI